MLRGGYSAAEDTTAYPPGLVDLLRQALTGALVAMALARLIQSMLFGIQATDVRLMVAVAVTMAVVGLLGCLVPAWRATRVDPVRALTG